MKIYSSISIKFHPAVTFGPKTQFFLFHKLKVNELQLSRGAGTSDDAAAAPHVDPPSGDRRQVQFEFQFLPNGFDGPWPGYSQAQVVEKTSIFHFNRGGGGEDT